VVRIWGWTGLTSDLRWTFGPAPSARGSCPPSLRVMPQKKTFSIACLGWGSLIWNPRDLPIRGRWFDDGPLLPIEFAQESRDGRITLVICEVDYRVRTYWALLEATDLQTAKSDLAAREEIKDKDIEHSIGYWDKSSTNSHGSAAAEIGAWRKQ
jgi:hypothetical protein